MIHIRPRTEWGGPLALQNAGHPMPAPMAKGLIVLHHSYAPHRPAGDRLALERGDMRGMDAYHRQKGWGGFSYHAGGFQSGNCYEGRPLSRTGAHTAGQNSKSWGYVLVIDGDRFRPSDAALETFDEWCRWMFDQGYLTRDYVIRPHSDFAPKSCPGNMVKPLIPRLVPDKHYPTLRLGDRGEMVVLLQKKLGLSSELQTGFFGRVTESSVMAVQKAAGLSSDGIVGPNTWPVILSL